VLTARIQITGLLLSRKPGAGTYTGIMPETAAGTVWLAQLGRTPGTPRGVLGR
jgi:hypothetical protein